MSNHDLDQSAAELGMGGKLAPESDDAGYRKRMERRQQVQKQRVEERNKEKGLVLVFTGCLLYTSPSPRDYAASRMPSSA